MAQVFLENVTKVFDGKVTAVDNLTLNVADQEFMVIVGPSGCGKTTILRLIAGLENLTSGTITMGDTLVNDVPPKDRDVAMVFQNYALYPHMTVYDNMAFNLKLRKHSKNEIKKRVTNAAELLGIKSLFAKKPKALSGGQRQRVALGRAIVQNPVVFLFDEPLSNLDPQLRAITRIELKALHQKLRTTSIYVTHDQAEAMVLGNRVAVINNGIIQQVGSPLDIYNRPANKFVASFLGSPSMNFFRGRVVFENGTPWFVMGNITFRLSKEIKDNLGIYKNKEMVLGIRPESLSLDPKNQKENRIPASVETIEPLGNRLDVYLATTIGHKFTACVDSHVKLEVGSSMEMYFDAEKAHIFEVGDTGKNVSLKNKN